MIILFFVPTMNKIVFKDKIIDLLGDNYCEKDSPLPSNIRKCVVFLGRVLNDPQNFCPITEYILLSCRPHYGSFIRKITSDDINILNNCGIYFTMINI